MLGDTQASPVCPVKGNFQHVSWRGKTEVGLHVHLSCTHNFGRCLTDSTIHVHYMCNGALVKNPTYCGNHTKGTNTLCGLNVTARGTRVCDYRRASNDWTCTRPPLGSNPGANQPKMKKYGLDYLAPDPAYVNFRKTGDAIAISSEVGSLLHEFAKAFYQAWWLNMGNHPCYRPSCAAETNGVLETW